MHPIGVLILLATLWFVVCGSRRSALLSMLVGVLYVTEGQALNLGINFFVIRILGIALFARVLIRREFSFRRANPVDKAVLILYVYLGVVYLIRSKGEDLSPIAAAFDACFAYFGFRGLIKGEADLRWLLRTSVFVLVPYALLVAVERRSGVSPFFFMGGPTGGWEREGVPRCMGSFRYPVSLGALAATFLALYVSLCFSAKDRRFAYIGVVLCLWIVVASNSGGSITAAGVAFVGWLLWYFRKDMRVIRWIIVGALVGLGFVMKAPIWYVLDRVSFGGDSWHRAYLIDVAMRNIGTWWAFGMDVAQTQPWFPYTINGGADITNQYLVYGLNAGVAAIILLILVLTRSFAKVGEAVAKLRVNRVTGPSIFLLWGLGVTLGVHVITWFGISYFDQIYAIFFLQLAAAISLAQEALTSRSPKEWRQEIRSSSGAHIAGAPIMA